MGEAVLEPCPGCGALLPQSDGPVHRYIGASAACWALYTSLANAGEPPMAPGPPIPLLVDAYAVQHPGQPSDQAIQSVAVHLLSLYGVLVRGASPADAIGIRQRALRQERQPKRGRFVWLEPPSFTGSLTVADIVKAPTPQARTDVAGQYVRSIWSIWSEVYLDTIAEWYKRYVLVEKL